MGFSLGKTLGGLLGGGDSGSSSSTSTATNYTDSSTKTENVTDFGMLAHDNVSLGASSTLTYNEQGLTGENLNSVLGTVNNLNNSTQSALANTFDKMVTSVQASAETAINTTAQAFADSDNELRSTIDGLRPIVLYATLGAIVYFIFKGSK